VQKCHVLQVERPVGPKVVEVGVAYPMDTKYRLDRRNQGTEGVVVIEREDNPTLSESLASAVDFRQVVDPR
jgi:hypothetical protein